MTGERGGMEVGDVLVEAYGRLPELVRSAVEGLEPEALRWTPDAGANPIGWLVWHLTRVQDDHVADILGLPQVWVEQGWAGRFGADPAPSDTGFGHTPQQVAALRPASGELLIEYFTAVFERTRGCLAGLRPEDLDRIVDERWDPPVTLGVRLVSVLDDDCQHVGQAAYVRGLLERHRG
ncbi:MAG TPA: DinB family protein [Kineosporiaceae bacterium]